MTVTRAQLVAEARKWVGTEYDHEGRVLGKSADCICIPLMSARAYGLTDFSVSGYSRVPDGTTILQICRARPELIEVAAYQLGDMLVMGWGKVPTHFGIVGNHPIAGEYTVIHASSIHKTVVEHRIDSRWHMRIKARFQFKGVV